jgi:hypothetical protein
VIAPLCFYYELDDVQAIELQLLQASVVSDICQFYVEELIQYTGASGLSGVG